MVDRSFKDFGGTRTYSRFQLKSVSKLLILFISGQTSLLSQDSVPYYVDYVCVFCLFLVLDLRQGFSQRFPGFLASLENSISKFPLELDVEDLPQV